MNRKEVECLSRDSVAGNTTSDNIRATAKLFHGRVAKVIFSSLASCWIPIPYTLQFHLDRIPSSIYEVQLRLTIFTFLFADLPADIHTSNCVQIYPSYTPQKAYDEMAWKYPCSVVYNLMCIRMFISE